MPRFTEQSRQVLIRYSRPGSVDITQQEIAEDLDRNRATINEHCRRLCELGYLERIDHGRYQITEQGKAVLERRPAHAQRSLRCPDCGRKILI
jgi:Mn-dependent DtxR family transcriptional regulator